MNQHYLGGIDEYQRGEWVSPATARRRMVKLAGELETLAEGRDIAVRRYLLDAAKTARRWQSNGSHYGHLVNVLERFGG